MKFTLPLVGLLIAAANAADIAFTQGVTDNLAISKVGSSLKLKFRVGLGSSEFIPVNSLDKAFISIPLTDIPTSFAASFQCATSTSLYDTDASSFVDERVIGAVAMTADGTGFKRADLSTLVDNFGEPDNDVFSVSSIDFDCTSTPFNVAFNASKMNAAVTISTSIADDVEVEDIGSTPFSLIIYSNVVSNLFSVANFTAIHDTVNPQSFSILAVESSTVINAFEIELVDGVFVPVVESPTCVVSINDNVSSETIVAISNSNLKLSITYTPARKEASTFDIRCDNTKIGVLSTGISADGATGAISGSATTSQSVFQYATALKVYNLDPNSAMSASFVGAFATIAIAIALLF